MVVVDVGGGHPECLGPRAAKLLGEVVVSHTHVYSVARTDNAGDDGVTRRTYMKGVVNSLGDTVRCREDP